MEHNHNPRLFSEVRDRFIPDRDCPRYAKAHGLMYLGGNAYAPPGKRFRFLDPMKPYHRGIARGESKSMASKLIQEAQTVYVTLDALRTWWESNRQNFASRKVSE